jgi:hypothetical protein
MSADRQEPGLREAELLRALGEHTAPRPVSWALALGLVLGGGAFVTLVVRSVGQMTERPTVVLEQTVDPELWSRAVSAYKRADWDAAQRLFSGLRERYPDNSRAKDYLDRIELTRRDAELLDRAEEALVGGQPERARVLSERVAANSPLFAQAETLSRNAQAQVQEGHAAGFRSPPEVAARMPSAARAALGEALALYEEGRFEEAAQRAQTLSARARGPVQEQLTRWANDAVSFASIYRKLPAEGPGLLAQRANLETAVSLDERLSDGHYARTLRARAAQAWMERAASLLQNGQIVDACGELIKARTFVARPSGNPALERRCESEAGRRVAQARGLERKRPEEARALYEQARALSLPGSPARRAADQHLATASAAKPR